jgi:hypothetical protein
MPRKTDAPLASIIASLRRHIAFLRKRGWKESALLLEVARLDLQARSHAISDRELRALCTILGSRKARTTTAALKRLLDGAGDTMHSQDTAANRRPSIRVVPSMVPHVRRSRGARREAR